MMKERSDFYMYHSGVDYCLTDEQTVGPSPNPSWSVHTHTQTHAPTHTHTHTVKSHCVCEQTEDERQDSEGKSTYKELLFY